MKTTNFYCSQKWTWLGVDLEKKSTQSCCTAEPSRVDIKWLKKNPGQLFNTPLLQQERQSMLDNQPVLSCESSCWRPERNGVASRRLIEQSFNPTHTELTASPDILNIIFGSTCNLTCSYCCKQYSSAWLHDIATAGPYLGQERFTINNFDRVLLQLSQPELRTSVDFEFLLAESSQFKNLRQVRISGGEPFLYNSLPALLDQVGTAAEVVINSGLGVNPDRFARQLDRITHVDNLEITVSAENINQFYEFNRYGNSYENFLCNLNAIKERNIRITFNSVISNLTVFGLADFVAEFGDYPIHYSFCSEPDFLAVNVLDSTSIDQLVKRIDQSQIAIKDQLIESLYGPATREQQENLSVYLKEFARRRNLDLAIFPRSMLQWLSI
jgi:organic radical activating enzyme